MQQQPTWLRDKFAGLGCEHARHSEFYPLVTCVAVGIVLFGLYNVWDFTENPNMNLRHRGRETPTWERYHRLDGERYMAHRAQLARLRANPVNCVATSIEDDKIWGKQHAECSRTTDRRQRAMGG